MIATVTLNAAIDKTIICHQVKSGGITRAEEALAVAGGKGINVARTVFKLGGEVLATGLAGGSNGAIIRNLLEQEKIDYHLVELRDNSRMCLTIIEKCNQTITELYDPSPVVQPEEWENFKRFMSKLARKADLITLDGSLPSGLSDEAYGELIFLIRKANERCKVILDTSGQALQKGIKAKPFMIKPNRDEMEILIGHSLSDKEEQIKAVKTLLEEGIEVVVLSLGNKGVVFGYNRAVYQVDPLAVEVKSPVGCGDALVGGFAHRFLGAGDVIEAVKYGVASATSNLTSKTQGNVSRTQVEEFSRLIKLYQV